MLTFDACCCCGGGVCVLSDPAVLPCNAIASVCSVFVICNVLFSDVDGFIGTLLRMILSLKTKLAKLLPYTTVKAIPATTKTAPMIKMIYPLCNIHKRAYHESYP
jgi:hypothetical protein